MSHVHVIAEAGTNHGGSLETAKKLIDAAAKAGADSVKFQLIYPEGLYLPRFYENGVYVENEVFSQREASMLSDDEYRELARYALQKGLPLSASVFDRRGIDLLDELDVPYFKIASCDLNDSPLLMRAAERGRKMIVSTGMATLDEIARAVRDIRRTGNEDIVLMHCVSVYPATMAQMNLSFVETLKDSFGLPVGLSDHTETSLASAMAAALGVAWIEKHFTLDRSAEGFDHAYAMEPDSFVAFVSDVREAEAACEARDEKVGAAEALIKGRARRGLYAARDLAEGEALAEEDVLIVRPESSLAPNDLEKIVGRKLVKGVRQYEALSPGLFGGEAGQR